MQPALMEPWAIGVELETQQSALVIDWLGLIGPEQVRVTAILVRPEAWRCR
jgi:hypothetical protein